MNELQVSKEFFTSLENQSDLTALIEGKITHLVTIQNKRYCLAGALGTGTGVGWAEMYAYEAVPVEFYDGTIAPLPYGKHFKEVDQGNRKRSYNGLLAKHKGVPYVLTGEQMVIRPKVSALSTQQLDLF